MRNYRIWVLLFLLPSLFYFSGCSDSDNVDEYQVLLDYLEQDDFINTAAPAIKAASDVKIDMTSGSQYVIDIRSNADFVLGHIEGAVNVQLADLLTHVEGLTSDYESIVIVCYSGQTAAYGACMLRLMGFDNVYSMKFGMSSWNSDFDSWSSKLANTFATDFETTDNPKGAEQKAPKVDTGKDKGRDILKAQVKHLLTTGFGEAGISASDVVPNAGDYFIINYWPHDQYLNPGHIAGAYCYVPKEDLKSSTYLKTLPTNQTIVVYCYTGQTSAYVTAYLKVLGYDAKSLKFGANNMIYDEMPGGKFAQNAIMNYEYVTGN
jgi:rhodanese-related sulfurtransferase